MNKKEQARLAIARRKHEAYMRDVVKRVGVECGHRDCEAFNAGSSAIAEALDWALAQNVPVEWLQGMIAKGLVMAMVANRISPADVNGESVHQPHEVN